MTSCDVLLVNPPCSKLGDGLEHIGLGYLASSLRRQHISVRVIDLPVERWPLRKALQQLSQIDCSLIGVSLPYQETAKEALDFICDMRNSGITTHITVGGIYPTFGYEEIMELYPAVDSVVLGEGEETIVDVAKALAAGRSLDGILGVAYRRGCSIVTNKDRPSVSDLDGLPFPDRDTLEAVYRRYGFASMLTSRGCYGRCTFCSVDAFYSRFGPKFRLRSSQNVLEELELLYDRHSVRNVMFSDANFICGKGIGASRAAEIAEGILEKQWDLEFRIQCRVDDVDEHLFALMRRAGLTRVYLGVESGSQTMLERFRKGVTVEDNYRAIEILNKLGIFISMGFIMFDDRTDMRELNENIAFVKRVKSMVPKQRLGKVYPLTKLIPLAGTEVERYMKQHNKYKGNSLRFSYKFDDPVIDVLYNTMSSGASLFWSFRKLFSNDDETTKDWVRGWRQSQR